MYCYVIFSKSRDKHTKKYLYRCDGISSGDIVVVPTYDSKKTAFVHSLIDEVPLELKEKQIKSVTKRSEDAIKKQDITSYILAMVDEYKDGNICKEDFYKAVKHFIMTNTLELEKEQNLYDVIYSQVLNLGTFCRAGAGDDDRELYFWKKLKDIEYQLRYGHSFWEKSKWEDRIKNDPIEKSDGYLRVELALERQIRNEIGEGGYMGYCHKYWETKKRILMGKYGIDWKSPYDMNPGVFFD